MDEQQQPQQPATPQTEEKAPPDKRLPLTPLQLRNRYRTEGIIVFLVLLWFVYDGWYSTEISHSGRNFSRLGSVGLAWWFIWDVYTVVKYHRAAQKAPTGPESTPPSSTPQ